MAQVSEIVVHRFFPLLEDYCLAITYRSVSSYVVPSLLIGHFHCGCAVTNLKLVLKLEIVPTEKIEKRNGGDFYAKMKANDMAVVKVR